MRYLTVFNSETSAIDHGRHLLRKAFSQQFVDKCQNWAAPAGNAGRDWTGQDSPVHAMTIQYNTVQFMA